MKTHMFKTGPGGAARWLLGVKSGISRPKGVIKDISQKGFNIIVKIEAKGDPSHQGVWG